MKSRLRLLFIFVLLAVIAACTGTRISMERNFGRGPLDSSGQLSGESTEVAFVANSLSGTVSLIDLEELKLIHTLDVVPEGFEVGFFRDPVQSILQSIVEGQAGKNYVQDTDLSNDGRVLFVSRGYLADIAAFEIISGDLLWRTQASGLRSDHMDISPDGQRLYSSSIILSGDRVQVIDTASGDVLGDFRTGEWPHDVQVSADGREVFVASLGNMLADEESRGDDDDAYTITRVDTRTLERLDQYTFPSGVRPFHVSQDGSHLHAQLSNTHDVVLFDLKSREISARQTLPIDDGLTEADWDFEAPHHGLAVSPDESLLCIAGRASDYAALVNASTLEVEQIIDTGDAPSWAAINESGSLCVLPNTRSDDVSILDLATRQIIATIKVQSGPKHVSIGRVPKSVIEFLKERNIQAWVNEAEKI